MKVYEEYHPPGSKEALRVQESVILSGVVCSARICY